ncbi:MAG: AMP-binding protein [Candidatus Saganbacteria bacterium]|nr:AMP-binding protein [Candidatus Saganbacteria bacterium]
MSSEVKTIKEIVEGSARKFGDYVALQMKHDDKYAGITFAEAETKIRNLGANLSEMGITHGDRVALLSENRPEWAISYLSIAYIGAVVVPLDALSKIEDLEPIINHSGAKGIIISDKFLSEIKQRRDRLPDIQFIISLDAKENKPDILSFNALVKHKMPAPQNKVIEEDLAAIVYTSGTTGIPKGVMLTNKNIVSDVLSTAALFDIGPKDNFLSVLPLHHTFETTAGFLAPYFLGAKITYAESLKSYTLLQIMNETGVTIMCGVPLLYQLFFDGIKREVEEKGKVAESLFKTLFALSKGARSLGLNVGRKLFSMVHKKLGGKIHFWVSGAAAIDPEVIHGFDLMGITILQGYGLTESSPILTCCTLSNNKIGSVGKAIHDVKIMILNPDEKGYGEILAKGPNIMKGYYKRPDETAETLKDGWLHTGDIGYMDKDGCVYVTGRQKDVIVPGSGLNVYPDEVEFVLNKSPFIKESCVIGRKVAEGVRRGMEEVYAVILPNMEGLEKYAAEKNLLLRKELVRSIIVEELKKRCEALPEYKRVMNFEIRETDFPKTSTKKIKRYTVRKELGLI